MQRIVILLAIVALAAGLWLGLGYFERGLQRPPPPSMRSGALLGSPRPLQPFSLTADDGSSFTDAALRERWTFLAFGYTNCPDVCPTTMATFKETDRLLQERGHPPAEFVFISVDPERDSPEQIGSYVRFFSPRFRGATGSHAALKALTDQLGVLYARVEGQQTALGYLVDHSASILVVDPQARLAMIFSPPQDPRLMAEDFVSLTRAYDQPPNKKP